MKVTRIFIFAENRVLQTKMCTFVMTDLQNHILHFMNQINRSTKYMRIFHI